MNLLFICSRNQWRSPTAEAIFKKHPFHHAKSAGTEPSARIKVTAQMIQWADIVFAMEKRHKERLLENFPEAMAGKQIIVLEIAEEYQFMDEELIEHLNMA